MKARLYRLGADPEFVFGWTPDRVMPAFKVIGRTENKEPLLTSYIGTDNHPATAELRISPSHSILRMMQEMAHALVTIEQYCASVPSLRGLKMYAHPWVKSPEGHDNQEGEHLGGHIHSSVLIYDNDLSALYKAGAAFTEAIPTNLWFTTGTSGLSTEVLACVSRIKLRLKKGELIYTPQTYITTLGWLMGVLEKFVPDWGLRAKRNIHYGTTFDGSMRIQSSKPPRMAPESNMAYLHYEYRVPSTWLTHPWIAYAYLALMKTCMSNFERVAQAAIKYPNEEVTSPLNAYHLLLDRMTLPGLHLTSDCDMLPRALQQIHSHRHIWCKPAEPVNIPAWERLLH